MISIAMKDSSGIKYSEHILKLAVGASQYVFPTQNLFSVGDIICFDSHVDSSSKWHSSDESVLRIDSDSGIGQVLSSRLRHGTKITVYKGDRNTGSLKFDLEIKDADKIEFTKSYDVMSGENYRASLVIKNHHQIDKITNLVS